MRNKEIDRKDISIRIIIISSFIILMLSTVSIIGYMLFSNWLSSTDEYVTKIAEDVNHQIYYEINMLIDVPERIGEVNHKLIEDGVIDIDNQIKRERFFVDILRSFKYDIYSVSYGTEAGEYYGARRNEDNTIEIMRNNAETEGHSWYYSLTEDLTAGELSVDAGEFDPRTRDWYRAAKEAGKAVFSPVYKHFIEEDLAISSSVPVYNKARELEGVIGARFILSSIDTYLKDSVRDKNALAVIVEKDSGELIANTFGVKNFEVLEDGSIRRLTIDEIENQAMIEAYENYKSTGDSDFKAKNENDKLHVNITEYRKEGLDWIIITSVPESLYTAGIFHNIRLLTLLTILAVIVSIIIYLQLTKKFLRPMNSLIDVTEKLSQGDLYQRVPVVRNDEIGKISRSFNKMADTISILVNNLEAKVKERTTELEVKNNELNENKEQLQLILNSTVEAIYGMDTKGNCTFCNSSGLRMLGYSSQDELLGKNIHLQIHHSYKDGTPMPLDECKIFKALLKKKGAHEDDEVFWRADGTCFNVEYYSYPQFKDGEIIGAVVTFTDNTEKKKSEGHIKYLSYHDSLTGLYNRMFFQDELKKLDTKKSLPISIIFGDVNGLKLTNDIFGHAAGDKLLKKSAEILKKVCREEDIVARIGGDEFAILLPNTEAKDVENVIRRIKKEFSKEKIEAIKCNISIGYDTKICSCQDIEEVMENAESEMYKDKMLNKKNINSSMIETIIETIHSKSPREKQHSINVSKICGDIGVAMKMSETEIRKLKDVGFLHDIGKIVLEEEILGKEGILTEEEKKKIEQHTAVGFRILNLFEDTIDLAEGVLYHHENWDGLGYPKGLKEEEIPKIARIIRVAEIYDALTSTLNKNAMNKKEALKEIKRQSGVILDPDVVDIFIRMMA